MPNIIEGIRDGANRIIDTAKKNSHVEFNNPFDDGKGGINISVGNIGGVGINIETGKYEAEVKASVRTGSGTGAITSSIGGKVDRVAGANIGVFGEVSTEGLGSTRAIIGVKTIIPSVGVQNRDKDGNLRVDASFPPIDGLIQLAENRQAIKEVENNLQALKEAENNQTRAQSQQKQPQSQQRQPQSQQRQPQSQQRQSPNLPQGTPQSIPQFGTPQQTITPTRRIPSEFTPRREATQQPFTIPTDIPKTNTRLPRKPQIGGKTAQQNSGTNQRNSGIALGGNAQRQSSNTSQRNGGIFLGGNGAPQQDNRVNQRNSGRTIVSPEELEDISANNPNNKPRIVQPQQNSEPRSAYRLLSAREKQLFDCIQNGGGDACNRKYGENPQANAGSSSGKSNEISLQFGDPYIGMGVN